MDLYLWRLSKGFKLFSWKKKSCTCVYNIYVHIKITQKYYVKAAAILQYKNCHKQRPQMMSSKSLKETLKI